MIVIGVDAHRDTHTAAAINGLTAAVIEHKTLPAREAGHRELLAWAAGINRERVWAIEDCRNLSGGLERFLLEHGERVLRVPPKLMSKERKSIRSFGKSDAIDPLAVARAAVSHPNLPIGRPATVTREIRLIIDHRDDLVEENTRHQRRLREHLHELDPELQPPVRCLAIQSNLNKLARQLARRPQTTQVLICRELIGRVRELTRRTVELQRQLAVMVQATCPALLDVEGCGVLTARILADVETIERFENERRFASYCGVSPLDASSGRQHRDGPVTRLLTAAEVSEILRVPRSTVYELARTRRIPFLKVGRRTLFDPELLTQARRAGPARLRSRNARTAAVARRRTTRSQHKFLMLRSFRSHGGRSTARETTGPTKGSPCLASRWPSSC